MTPRRVHIIGRKNSGKTTLIVALLETLTAGGQRVGAIKHTHHRHELDTPGKDSYRHREAGATAVGILSPALNAVFWPVRDEGTADRYAQLIAAMGDCDLVLVEGDSQTEAAKIEVWRAATNTTPFAAEDQSILAVVSDDELPAGIQAPRWPRSDVAGLARRIVGLGEPGPSGPG